MLKWDHWHIEPSSICALRCSRDPAYRNAIDGKDVIDAMDFIIKIRPNTCIEEIIIWVNFDHK